MANPNDIYGTSNGYSSLKTLFDTFYNGSLVSDEYFAIVLLALPAKKVRDSKTDQLWGLVQGYESSTEFYARALTPINPENSPLTPHDFLLNPCDPIDYLRIIGTGGGLSDVIKAHTKFKAIGEQPELKPNTIVKVRFTSKTENGKKVFNLSVGEFISIATATEIKALQANIPTVLGCDEKSMIEAMKSGNASVLGGGFSILAESFPEPGDSERIEGDEFASLTSIVDSELSLWRGKKEDDPSMYSTLKKYWDNIGTPEGAWTPTGTPWSAVFISFMIGSVDPGFPKAIAHYDYAKACADKKGGWTAWKLTPGKFYKAQVGDILVKSRPSEKNPNSSHGDLVFKIESNIAYLAGGNVSNKAKVVKQVPIDGLGNYSSFSPYLCILKKNGAVQPFSPGVA